MSSINYNNEDLITEIKTLTGLTSHNKYPDDEQPYILINVNKVCGTLSKIGEEDKNQKYDVDLTESTIWLTKPDISSDELWRINDNLRDNLLPRFCTELDFKACTKCIDNTNQNSEKIQFFCVEHETIVVCEVFFTDPTPYVD